MIRMFVRHAVRNYGEWKAVYDGFEEEREQMGVVKHHVFPGIDDPNDVTCYHDFEDMETAKQFIESARLREVMDEAGVSGEPEIWFTKL